MTDLTRFDELLAAALPEHSLYAVGGRVRDEIRSEAAQDSLQSKDGDYVIVGLSFEEVERRLQHIGRLDKVGALFSIIKLTRDGVTVDIGLPRRERSTGSGHRDFLIESGPEVSLADDLARRDFRMNMIARALPSRLLIDPYQGVEDIRAARIDILREDAFVEDPLRMLRACQFAARFEYALTPRTLEAMQTSAHLITTVSGQRMFEELSKLFLLAKRPSLGIDLMRESGLLAEIWPEFLEGIGMEQNQWHAYDVYRHNLVSLDAAPANDLIVRVAALFHDVGKPRVKDGPHFYRHEFIGEDLTHDMLLRTSFPHDIVRQVCHLVRNHMYSTDSALSDAAVRRFIRRIGIDMLDKVFSLRSADICGSGLPKRDTANEYFQERVAQQISAGAAFTLQDLKLRGNDIITAFHAVGLEMPPKGDKRVGEILQHFFEIVTDSPQANQRELLLSMVQEYIARQYIRQTTPSE